MGHRAIIAYQEPSDMTWTTRYSHWGANEAKLMGTEWAEREHEGAMMPARHGKRRLDEGLETLEAVGQTVDFLYHEAVYVVPLGGEARAFDTVWWKGAQNYIPSPGGTQGVGALVELEDADEWTEFAGDFWEASEEMEAVEFHEAIKELRGDRIPDWSPMGGDELRVDDEYLPDDGNQHTNAE